MICSEVLTIIRSKDIAGRYGGEEFGILLPETGTEQTKMVAEKIRTRIENIDIVFQNKQIKVTASFGVSSLSQCGDATDDPDRKIDLLMDMIKMADIAMYYAKSAKCSSCSFKAEKDIVLNEKICPECKANLLPDRNRVEVYSPEISGFDKE